MAEKVLGFRIEVRGTDQQTTQLSKLGGEIDQIKARIKLLNDLQRKGIPLTAQQRKERELLNTQLKASRSQYNTLNKEILQNNGVIKKSTGLYGGFKSAMKSTIATTLGWTAAIGAVTKVVGSAISIVVDYQKANSKLEAILKATETQMTSLKNQSKELGATTAFTATQVTELQTEYAKLGFPTDEILNMTRATLDGAAALGSELGKQAALTGATLKQYSLDSTEAGRVNDVLAKSASSSALDFQKLATALPIVGATAKTAGVDLERTTALLGTLSDRGLDASTSGTALRNIFLELSKQGLTYNEAMAKINNATDKNAVAMDLFGKRGATASIILAEAGGTIDELEASLNDADGAARKMADTMLDNLAGDATKAQSAWEGLVLSFEDGSGVLSQLSRQITQVGTSYLGMLTAINNSDSDALGVQSAKMLGVVTDSVNELGISTEDMLKAAQNNQAVFELMTEKFKNGEIDVDRYRAGIEKLAGGWKQLTDEEKKNADESIKNKKLKDEQANAVLIAEENAAKEAAIEKKKSEEAKKIAAERAKERKKEQEQKQKEIEASAKKEAEIRKKGEEDAQKFIKDIRDKAGKSERELALMDIEAKFDEKINAITGQSEREIQLAKDIELAKRDALAEQQAEFDLADAEKAVEERALKLENELLLAEEDLIRQNEILEKQRLLELENENLTAEQKKAINIDYNKQIADNEEAIAQMKTEKRRGELSAAAGLADALGGLAKEGSVEAKAFATAAALINTYLAITGALANGAKLGPFAVAAQVATASAIGFANVARINGVTFQDGGLVEGASHSEGGIQMWHKGGQHLGEMEGNEYIISAKRVEEIGKDNLDAINFGGISPSANGFFANGGSVPTFTSTSTATSQGVNGLSADAIGMVIAQEMEKAILNINVTNNAVETFDTALNVQNTKQQLSFG